MEITRIFDILDYYLIKYPSQDVALASKKDRVWNN